MGEKQKERESGKGKRTARQKAGIEEKRKTRGKTREKKQRKYYQPKPARRTGPTTNPKLSVMYMLIRRECFGSYEKKKEDEKIRNTLE